jgi:HK97 gp10 family phage protein
MSFEKDNERLMKKKRKEAMFKIASIIHADAKRRCPADTGRLRKSISIIKYTDKEAVVGTNIPYAVHVEYGTKTMEKAHGKHSVTEPVTDWEAKRKRGALEQTMPFLRPAVYFNRERIKKIMKDEFER